MILRGDEMEDIGNLQKIFHVYEERYHKAEKMGIDESSPFYAAPGDDCGIFLWKEGKRSI